MAKVMGGPTAVRDLMTVDVYVWRREVEDERVGGRSRILQPS